MMLADDIINVLRNEEEPLTAEGLSIKINLNNNILEARLGIEERRKKKFDCFKIYLESMVENKELNYNQNKGGYFL